MATTLDSLLERKPVLIADGAMGSLLAERATSRGVSPPVALDQIAIDCPKWVEEIHREYASAGSNILLTNTFAATKYQLERRRTSTRLEQLLRQAAQTARDAAGDDRLVFGDLGPIGDFFAPMGKLTREAAIASYRERARLLTETALLDGLLVETQTDRNEVKCAIEGIRSVCDLPLAITMSFDAHGRTMMGVRPEELATLAVEKDVAFVGANCGRTIEETYTALKAMRDVAPGIKLWAKPNAGLPTMQDGVLNYTVDPEAFGRWAVRFAELGVRVFGGCCGTTPQHIVQAVALLGGSNCGSAT